MDGQGIYDKYIMRGGTEDHNVRLCCDYIYDKFLGYSNTFIIDKYLSLYNTMIRYEKHVLETIDYNISNDKYLLKINNFSSIRRIDKISTGFCNKNLTIRKEYSDLVITTNFLRELNMLIDLDHPNIAKVLGINSRERFSIFFPFYGKNLCEVDVTNKKEILKKVCETVLYLHEKNIVHSDIKRENIVYDKTLDKVTLIDFEFAIDITKYNKTTEKKYTPIVSPPEYIFSENEITIDKPVDIWSLGMTIVEFIYDLNPLDIDEKVLSVYDVKIAIKYLTKEKLSKLVTDEILLDLVSKMLEYEAKDRITIQQVLQHEYFQH